jgi:hypothetical protein
MRVHLKVSSVEREFIWADWQKKKQKRGMKQGKRVHLKSSFEEFLFEEFLFEEWGAIRATSDERPTRLRKA